MHPDLQGKIPPFRDAYQTATYAATLSAVDDGLSSRYSEFHGVPRIYEIARSGPFDLTGKPQSKAGQPDNPNLKGWFTLSRAALIAFLVLSTIVAFSWVDRIIGVDFGSLTHVGQTADSRRSWLGAPSWLVLILAGFVSWILVYSTAACSRDGGEPFAWFAGISIWPTECIRILVLFMATWFLLKTHHALSENECTIAEDFGLEGLDPIHGSTFSNPWPKHIIASLSLQRWLVKDDKGEKVVAQKLWYRYLLAGQIRVRILRVAPLALLYFLAGACLMLLLGVPPVPARGAWSFALDLCFIGFAVISSIWVTFYIADATILNRRLIDYLVDGETQWPDKAYANLRKRWSQPPPQTEPSVTKDQALLQETIEAGAKRKELTEEKLVKDAGKPEKRPPDLILAQYLDIDLIAKRTEVVGALIYYPFVLISLLIVSRIPVFDNWTWPAPLLIVIGLNGGYAAWSAFSLRKTAEKARQEALRNLTDLLIARTAEECGTGAEAGDSSRDHRNDHTGRSRSLCGYLAPSAYWSSAPAIRRRRDLGANTIFAWLIRIPLMSDRFDCFPVDTKNRSTLRRTSRRERHTRPEDDQTGAALFADENKDAGGQRHNVEQENGWPDIQAEP